MSVATYRQLDALEALADCEDVSQLDRLLREARCSLRELAAIRGPGMPERKRDIAPRLAAILERAQHNATLRQRRAAFALELLGDAVVTLA